MVGRQIKANLEGNLTGSINIYIVLILWCSYPAPGIQLAETFPCIQSWGKDGLCNALQEKYLKYFIIRKKDKLCYIHTIQKNDSDSI